MVAEVAREVAMAAREVVSRAVVTAAGITAARTVAVVAMARPSAIDL